MAEISTTQVASARRALALIDLTDLNDDSTDAAVEQLADRAATHGTAAVCVWPDFVRTAVAALASTPVRVATVVNFPTGDERSFAVGVLTERAMGDGADEIDVVLPHRSFVSGDTARASDMLRVVRGEAADAVMKVILETGELPDQGTVKMASRFAIEHGADFVKTSTGKTARSATTDAVVTMLATIAECDRPVGLKPSGGIRTLADAVHYLDLADQAMGAGWVSPETFRFGASGLLDALLAVIDGDGVDETGNSSADSDY